MYNGVSGEPDLAVAKMASLSVSDSSYTATDIVTDDTLSSDAAGTSGW